MDLVVLLAALISHSQSSEDGAGLETAQSLVSEDALPNPPSNAWPIPWVALMVLAGAYGLTITPGPHQGQ